MKICNAKVRNLCICGVIAAVYAAVTLALAPISYGVIQFRISEALCILPYFFPQSAWGLFVGCLIANTLSGNIFDIVIGSLATLAAGLCTAYIGKRNSSLSGQILACLMPVLFNSLVIGAVLTIAYEGRSILAEPNVFAVNALYIALGEGAVMLLIGFPLMSFLKKKDLRRIIR